MALALMRRHRRWLYVFLWLVIAAFIILYIPALTGTQSEGTPSEAVATVGGLPVTVGEFQRTYQRQKQVYDRLYQGRMTPAMLKQLGLEEQVFESLVSDRIVELEAKRLGITVSDDAVARAISTAPEFQDGGRFIGTDEIRRRLDLQGMTEEQFAEALRQQLTRASLMDLVGSAAVVSDAEVERELARRNDQVKVEYVLADAERFRAGAAPTEDEIKARFEAKKDQYRIPERRVLSYALLDREALRPGVVVTDRDLEVYYQDHRDEFRQEAEACASHILVKVKQGEAGEGHPEAEAKAIAQGLLDQVKAGGDFAAIARKSSEDQGSAANGGDLGCFPPGRMVPQFDDAVFDLAPGQVSDLVKTNFGYHIIRLASKKEETTAPLAQVKDRVRAEVEDRKMSQLGEQKAQAIADALARGKSLEEAAKAQGIAVKTSPPFARTDTPAGLASPTLVARAFEMKKGDTEKEGFAVPAGAVFVSLADVQPAHTPRLEEVHDRVKADLVEERVFAQAQALAEAVRARAETAGLEKAAAASGLVRKETPSLVSRGQALADLGTGLALETAAFSLPEGALSEPVRTTAGYAVLRVLERKSADPADLARQKAAVAAQLRDQKRQELFRAFIVAARERYAVTRNVAAYRRATGEPSEG
jgi:peptidyl-prolyl cis-trans isomerase D